MSAQSNPGPGDADVVVRELIAAGIRRSLAAGEILCSENDQSAEARYVVLDGTIRAEVAGSVRSSRPTGRGPYVLDSARETNRSVEGGSAPVTRASSDRRRGGRGDRRQGHVGVGRSWRRTLRARFDVHQVHHLRRSSERDLGRLGRLAAGRGVGLVLSGGGARGYAHIGVYTALTNAGVPIDRVVGASMGSIVAAMICQRSSPSLLLADMQRGVDNLLDYTIPLVSLIKGERIVRVLQAQFAGWDGDDMWVPFCCVSTDLTCRPTTRSSSVRSCELWILADSPQRTITVDDDLILRPWNDDDVPTVVAALPIPLATVVAATRTVTRVHQPSAERSGSGRSRPNGLRRTQRCSPPDPRMRRD